MDLSKKRIKKLQDLKQEKENALKQAPLGSLRICGSNNRTQYYRYIKGKTPSSNYIRQEEWPLIPQLAQKDYDQKVLRAVNRELQAIE